MTGSLPSETFSLSLRVCESVFETTGKKLERTFKRPYGENDQRPLGVTK